MPGVLSGYSIQLERSDDFWRLEVKKIAIIGDYNQNKESHYLIMESIKEVAEEIQGELVY